MIFFGLLLIFIAISVDILFNGTPGYGLKQLLFLVIGSFAILLGIRILPLKKNHDIIFLVVYILGVLYIGLKPESYVLDYKYFVLSIHRFSISDFLINFFGFMPIGYIGISFFNSYRKRLRKQFVVLFVFSMGLFVSLFIEVCQYLFLDSRVASLYDFVANSLGTLVGCYMCKFLLPLEIYFKDIILKELSNRCNN